MSNIIEITGADLRMLLGQLRVPTDRMQEIYEIRVTMDGDKFKASVNFGMWSPPLGCKYER